MIRVRLTLQGLPPGLLLNPMSEETLDELWTGVRDTSMKGVLTPKQAAERKLYTVDGRVGLPQLNLFSCLAEAGRFIKFSGRLRQDS